MPHTDSKHFTYDEISNGRRASRPINIVRGLIGSLVIFVSYHYNLEITLWISSIHLFLAIVWFLFVEFNHPTYLKLPSLWYLISASDLFLVLVWIYLTGTSYSPAILILILITTVSSMDLNKNRGRFASLLGSFGYTSLSGAIYLQFIKPTNIVINEAENVITLFSFALSNAFVLISNYGANVAVHTIYRQLQDRNRDLEFAYSEIKDLKIQQDGDYYLTSLLIEPLASLDAKGAGFVVESKIQQFKKFRFNKKDMEIGGDINFSSIVSLQNDYLFFINADAMGKSIQGAGGSLVLSSVLKSILTRTEMGGYSQISGKDWLKKIYQEINSVFESFEGSMYVTSILGLVSQESNECYLIRAEHPHPVWFHPESGAILDTKIPNSSKLGTPHHYLEVHIFPCEWLSGAKLFIGSDGKDDLVSPKGSIQRSELDSPFIKAIHNSNGDMEAIWNQMKDWKDIQDDISLMCIYPIPGL